MQDPVEITADHFDFRSRLDVYVAKGHVRVVQGGRVIEADWAAFSRKTERGVASGRVRITEKDDVFDAEFVEFNLETLEGVMFGADLDLGADQFQIEADRLQKVGRDVFEVERATFTTCRCPEGERIPWKLRVGQGELELGRYATTKNTTLEILGVPALWLPWVMFPVKTERESGVLFPHFAIGGTNGFEVGLPIFWAAREDLNITFTPNYLTKRGFKPDLEFEYAINEKAGGRLYGSFIHDREVADSDQYSFGANRWAAVWEHTQQLPAGWLARADVKLVSDNEYPYDFAAFSPYRNFRYLESSAFVSRQFLPDGRLGVAGAILWADDIQVPDDIDRDPFLLQRLPEIEAELLPGPVPLIPGLVATFGSDYIYFYSRKRAASVLKPPAAEVFPGFLDTGVDATPNFREPGYVGPPDDPNRDDLAFFRGPELDGVLQDGEPLSDRGSRLVLYPRLAYPLRLFDSLELYPEVGYYQTLYFTEEQSFAQRGLVTSRVDLRSRIAGELELPLVGPVTHLVEPRLNWTFVQKRDQSGNPVFIPPTSVPQRFLRELDTESIVLDPSDRIEKANLVTFGAVNRFYGRSAEGVPNLLADVTFEAGYDFAQSRVALINFDGGARLSRWVQTRFDLSIDPDRAHIEQGRLGVTTALPRWLLLHGGSLGFGYRYRRDVPIFFSGRTEGSYDVQQPINQFDINTQLLLGPRWAVTYSMSFSIEGEELLRNAGGISYTSKCACWRIGVGVRQDRDRDVQFDFLISLLGLGDGVAVGSSSLAPGSR